MSLCEVHPHGDIEILLTENLRQSAIEIKDAAYPLSIIHNEAPRSFARNHNEAFKQARGQYFCISNPDVIFIEDIFPPLIHQLQQGQSDIIAPLILDRAGNIQDSFRLMPTVWQLLRRRLGRGLDTSIAKPEGPIYPDWIAGIFLLMHREVYRKLGGFNETFRLYFEDVDFGCRARLRGFRLMVDPSCKLVHDARRRSRRDARHLLWHLISAYRFFRSDAYWNLKRRQSS